MIKKLQKKFIAITALSLLSVIVIVMLCINIVNIYKNNQDLSNLITMIYKSDGQFPKGTKLHTDEPPASPENTSSTDSRPETDSLHPERPYPELAFTTRFGVVYLSSDKEILSINSENISAISTDTITDFTNRITHSGKSAGWISNYKYQLLDYNNGYMLILLDATNARNSDLSILLISFSVAAVSYTIILFIIIMISKKAIAPIAESYEKQKQFITNAGHELKTPLTVISANTEIARINYGESEWFDGIDKQTLKMQNLVHNLIKLSKMDEDVYQPVREQFCLSDAVYDTAKSFESLLVSRKLNLQMSICPDLYCYGDEAAIRQVVSILMDNAIKYCDTTGLIRICLLQEKNVIFLRIFNSFQHVANTELNKLCERFYRSDKSRTGSTGQISYGIGLAIAKSILDAHHWNLKVRNHNNLEILFEIKIPAKIRSL